MNTPHTTIETQKIAEVLRDKPQRVETIYNVKLNNRDDESVVTISKNYFDHLLNCLANQKYLHEQSPADRKNGQEVIDKAWRSGMFIMSLKHRIDGMCKQMVEKYCDFWNASLNSIQLWIDEDTNTDEYAKFKWIHLIPQEIEMWIRICCHSGCTVDCEREEYKVGMISERDFLYIVNIRGFNEHMIRFLSDILNHIGIWNGVCPVCNGNRGARVYLEASSLTSSHDDTEDETCEGYYKYEEECECECVSKEIE